MKSIFLVSNNQLPLNLQKLSSCLYYSQQKKQFYRLNFMPSCTVFANESVQKRQMVTLNKIDPVFLMINQLYTKKKVKQDELTYEGLKYNKNWDQLAYVDEINGNVVYSYNKEKVFDFLERKVAKMEQYLYENNPLDRIKLLQLQGKPMSSDTIILLKNQLPHDLVHELVKQRYDHNLNRKRAPQVEEVQALKPKPSKNNKKPQQKIPQKPKNQPTLFASWKKQ